MRWNLQAKEISVTDEPVTRQDATMPTQCGCGGEIVPGIGCQAYYDSDDYGLDYNAESVMWYGGLGFGSAVLEGPDQSIMALHLQHNDFTPEQADAVMFAPRAQLTS